MYFCVCLTAKKQKHDMVHVEVWLGDGPKDHRSTLAEGQGSSL